MVMAVLVVVKDSVCKGLCMRLFGKLEVWFGETMFSGPTKRRISWTDWKHRTLTAVISVFPMLERFSNPYFNKIPHNVNFIKKIGIRPLFFVAIYKG